MTVIHNEFVKGPDNQDIRADCVFEGTDGMILVSRDRISSRPGAVVASVFIGCSSVGCGKPAWAGAARH